MSVSIYYDADANPDLVQARTVAKAPAHLQTRRADLREVR